MTKKDILKATGLTEAQFYKLYPSKEAFHEALGKYKFGGPIKYADGGDMYSTNNFDKPSVKDSNTTKQSPQTIEDMYTNKPKEDKVTPILNTVQTGLGAVNQLSSLVGKNYAANAATLTAGAEGVETAATAEKIARASNSASTASNISKIVGTGTAVVGGGIKAYDIWANNPDNSTAIKTIDTVGTAAQIAPSVLSSAAGIATVGSGYGILGAAGDAVWDAADSTKEQTRGGEKRSAWSEAGSEALEGAGTGATLGATLGSIVPGIGNVVGGVVGGIAGLIGGGIKGYVQQDEKNDAVDDRNRKYNMQDWKYANKEAVVAANRTGSDFYGVNDSTQMKYGGPMLTQKMEYGGSILKNYMKIKGQSHNEMNSKGKTGVSWTPNAELENKEVVIKGSGGEVPDYVLSASLNDVNGKPFAHNMNKDIKKAEFRPFDKISGDSLASKGEGYKQRQEELRTSMGLGEPNQMKYGGKMKYDGTNYSQYLNKPKYDDAPSYQSDFRNSFNSELPPLNTTDAVPTIDISDVGTNPNQRQPTDWNNILGTAGNLVGPLTELGYGLFKKPAKVVAHQMDSSKVDYNPLRTALRGEADLAYSNLGAGLKSGNNSAAGYKTNFIQGVTGINRNLGKQLIDVGIQEGTTNAQFKQQANASNQNVNMSAQELRQRELDMKDTAILKGAMDLGTGMAGITRDKSAMNLDYKKYKDLLSLYPSLFSGRTVVDTGNGIRIV